MQSTDEIEAEETERDAQIGSLLLYLVYSFIYVIRSLAGLFSQVDTDKTADRVFFALTGQLQSQQLSIT